MYHEKEKEEEEEEEEDGLSVVFFLAVRAKLIYATLLSTRRDYP